MVTRMEKKAVYVDKVSKRFGLQKPLTALHLLSRNNLSQSYLDRVGVERQRYSGPLQASMNLMRGIFTSMAKSSTMNHHTDETQDLSSRTTPSFHT